jgi:DNA topoisomerase-like protein
LKQAKGIRTPATRAEIIGGLKKQGFLIVQRKNIVSTKTGLLLFAILKHADPALVDPGVTAQLECLLDDGLSASRRLLVRRRVRRRRTRHRQAEGGSRCWSISPAERYSRQRR